MWTLAGGVTKANTDDGHSRQKYVMDRLNASDSTSWVIETQRRFDLLRVEYEVRLLASQLYHEHHGGASTGREIYRLAEREFSRPAEELFSRLADVNTTQTTARRRNARPCLHMAGYEYGLGLMLMLGIQTRGQ